MALEGSGRNVVHIEYSFSYSYFDPTCTHRVPIVASRHRCIAKPLPNQVNAGDARAWPPTPSPPFNRRAQMSYRLPVPILCRIVKLSRLATYRHCTFQSGPQGQPLETHAPSHANLSILITLRAYSRRAATCASPPPDHQPEPANVRVRTVARPTAQSLLWESPFLVWVISAATSKTETLHIRGFGWLVSAGLLGMPGLP